MEKKAEEHISDWNEQPVNLDGLCHLSAGLVNGCLPEQTVGFTQPVTLDPSNHIKSFTWTEEREEGG